VGDDAGGARVLALGSGPGARAWLRPGRGGGRGRGGSAAPAPAAPLAVARWCRLRSPPPALLTAGFDGRLRLWTTHLGGGGGGTAPAAVFDLGAPLTDAAWLGGGAPGGGGRGGSGGAPPSTPLPPPPLAFVAALADGRLAGFELTRRTCGPVALQRVVRAGVRPTCLAACPPCVWGTGAAAALPSSPPSAYPGACPLVAVGDDRGRVTLLKPSPNLRAPAPERRKGGDGGGAAKEEEHPGGGGGALQPPPPPPVRGGRVGAAAAAATAALLAAVAVPPEEGAGNSSGGAAAEEAAAPGGDDKAAAPVAAPLSPAAVAVDKAVGRLVAILAELKASGAGEE